MRRLESFVSPRKDFAARSGPPGSKRERNNDNNRLHTDSERPEKPQRQL